MKFSNTYYLVEKDSELISSRWKVLAIICLAVSAVSSITCSFSFYSLNHGIDPVDHRCAINATPKIVVNETTGRSSIDLSKSVWGEPKDCDFATFGTLFQGMTAIIWICLFMMCGNGGASNTTLVSKPYRIVMPATIYFIALIIFSSYEVSFISTGITEFCNRLRNESGISDSSCAALFDLYNSPDVTAEQTTDSSAYLIVDSGFNYPLTLVVVWVALSGFCFGLLIMILRFLFVVDFELVKVHVKPRQQLEEQQPILADTFSSPSTSGTFNSSPHNGKLRSFRKRNLKVDERDRLTKGGREAESLIQ